MSDHLGAAVLRVHGDDASYYDIRTVVEGLVANDAFRSRACGSVGTLTAEIPESTRISNCEAMASILLTDVAPPHVNRKGCKAVGTAAFVRECVPPPRGEWEEANHLWANYSRKGRPDAATVSPFLHQVLSALEELWNLPGHLVVSGKT